MIELPIYRAWSEVPPSLKTKTQLSQEGLRLSKNQKPVGIFKSTYYKKKYKLYSVNEAIPKRSISQAQREVLEKARLKARTCQRCGKLFPRPIALCSACEHYVKSVQPVIKWAQMSLNSNSIILDTETTGLDYWDEIVEIAIIDSTGECLLNTLIKPTTNIPPEAQAIHSINNDVVADAPTWPEIHNHVDQILQNADYIVSYGAEFDWRMLCQTKDIYNLPKFKVNWKKWHCAMRQFAQFYGDWSHYYGSFKWQPLSVALEYFNIGIEPETHRALPDCKSVLKIIEAMAHA